MFNNLLANQGGYPNPTVAAKFAQSANDFSPLNTLSSMPSGGSISRAGNAMLYDSTGKLTYAPNNLLTYSQDYTNAAWANTAYTVTANATTAPDSSSTASKITPTTNNTVHRLKQTFSASYTNIFSVYAKAAGETVISIWLANDTYASSFDLSAGTATNLTSSVVSTITSVGNGWYRCSVYCSVAGNTASIYARTGGAFIGNGTDGVYLWGAQLEAVTYQTTPSTYQATTSAAYYGPRFDYDPSTLAAKGLLIEGTRTNLCTYSEQFDNAAWSKSAVTVSANAATSPDGTTSADLFYPTSTGAAREIYKSAGYTGGTTYTLSIYAKAAGMSWITFGAGAGSAAAASLVFFNVSTGAVGTTGSNMSNAKITSVGNGWYRLSVTYTPAASGGYLEISPVDGDNNYTGTTSGTNGIYLWGAQIEAGAFVSSYVSTVASSVARAAETFAITGYSSNLINATYIDEATGVTSMQPYNAGVAPSPSFSWLTALRVYTNAYAGNIATPSWLSFSRTGNATMTDSTGKLVWAPANNLTYSEDFSNAAWGTAASGATISRSSASSTNPNSASQTISSYSISAVTGANFAFAYQLSGQTVRVGDSYVGSVWIRGNAGTSGTIFIYVADGGGAPTSGLASSATVNFTGSWQRFSVNHTYTSSTGNFVYFAIGCDGRASNSSSAVVIDVWGAQLERVTYETRPSAYIPTTTAAVYGPRYDFDASTVPATPRGLLIEESRTNLATYSDDLSNAAWTPDGMLAFGSGSTVNAAISPDGTQNADLLTENTATGLHRVYRQFTVAANTSVAYSFYAKRSSGTRNIFVIVQIASDMIWCRVNLGTGIVYQSGSGGTGSLAQATCETVGPYYRIKLSGLISTTGTNPYAQIYLCNTSTLDGNAAPSYTGDGISGMYLWGMQFESGASFATSYIPTTSASVTRAADVAQWSSAAFSSYWNASAGTLISQFTKTDATQRGVVVAAGNSTSGSSSDISFDVLSGQFRSYIENNGSLEFGALTMGAYTAGSVARGGIAWTTNNANAAYKGTLAGADDTSVSVPTLSNVYIGAIKPGTSAVSTWLNGCVQSFAYYNQRLPNAILTQKSNVGAPY